MNRLSIHRRTHRSGLTLLEMVSTLTSVSVLLAGMASTLFITLRSNDPATTATDDLLDGNAAMTQLLTDLEFAQGFSELTSTAITFSVPDRNGDSNPETIRYAWSGIAGDPLTRQYNGGNIATLVDDVQVFQHDLPAASPNLLVNGDIEGGTAGWQAISNASLMSQSIVVHGGAKALSASSVLPIYNAGMRQNVTSVITSGTTYDVGGWIRKANVLSPFGVKLQLHVTSSGSGLQIFSAGQFNVSTSSWTHASGLVTPTWSGTLTSAYLEVCGVTNIQDIYLDDAYLKVHQQTDQMVNVRLQVGSDSDAMIHAGTDLLNQPL